MHFHFSFYSSILLIFFSQGIVFSYLLLKKGIQKANKTNYWLSLFVFLCSLYLLPWMLGFAGWYSKQPYRDIMFYTPFQQLLFIGPTIYFYTQSLLNPSFALKKKDWIHAIPGILYLIYLGVIVVTDKLILDEYFFYADGRDKNLDNWYQLLGCCSMLLYYLLSLRYYSIYKKVVMNTLSFADTVLFSWIKKYLLSFLLMQILWLFFFFFYPNWGNFKEKWWYYLSFSMLLYYIAITGYTNMVHSLVPFKMGEKKEDDPYLLEDIPEQAANDDEMEKLEAVGNFPSNELSVMVSEWKKEITHLIESKELYKNPQLTLLDVAHELGTNQTVVSKMINQGFKMNFNDLINLYRVNAVVSKLQQGEHKQQTLLGISIDCGFNSKTTFNRCFKKRTGSSPKDFLKHLETNNSSTSEF